MPPRLPVSLRFASILRSRRRRSGSAAGRLGSNLLCSALFGSLLLSSGCARLPPGEGSSVALSGKRLVVRLRFRGPVNPQYHYYFLINYDTSQGTALGVGNQNALGPIPVLGPTNSNQSYGNGFATSSTGVGGFTDFVRFEGNSYRLFHVVGDPTADRNFIDERQPISFTLPTASDPNVLQFELDLSQLVVNSNGAALTDPTMTVNIAKNIRFVQMNVVATNVVPINQTTIIDKQVDSLGNNQTQTGASAFLNFDLADLRTYTNQDFAAFATFEPSSNDVFTTGSEPDPSLDLLDDYSITVRQQ
jgi:hypothetical protein